MGSFDHREWRRLYTQEDGTFKDLPFLCRGTAAQLLKLANREGVITLGQFDLADTVCRRMAAHRNERRAIRRHIELLIEDQFIVPTEDGHWRIRNFVNAQTPGKRTEQRASTETFTTPMQRTWSQATESRERAHGAPPAPREQTVNAPSSPCACTRGESCAPCSCSRTNLNDRNNTSSSLTYAGADQEKRRGEERRNEHAESEQGAALQTPRSPAGSPLSTERVISSEPAPNKPRDASATQAVVREVLEHWATKLYPATRPVFDQKRIRRVKARLAEGFTAERLKRAIDGATLDDWLMGRADGARKGGWRDIETVFRDAAQVERLIALADASAPTPSRANTATPDLNDDETRKLTREEREASARAATDFLTCLTNGKPAESLSTLFANRQPMSDRPPTQQQPPASFSPEERLDLEALAATQSRRRERIVRERAEMTQPALEAALRGAS